MQCPDSWSIRILGTLAVLDCTVACLGPGSPATPRAQASFHVVLLGSLIYSLNWLVRLNEANGTISPAASRNLPPPIYLYITQHS